MSSHTLTRRPARAVGAALLAASVLALASAQAQAQTIKEFPLPGSGAPGAGPAGIAAGPDGALWFVNNVPGGVPNNPAALSYIGRISTAGAVTQFPLTVPNGFLNPTGIVVGSDGALWFTDPLLGQIGRITTSGAVSHFTPPTADSAPTNIVAGPDGALWFTEAQAGKIARLTTGGAFTEFQTGAFPTSLSGLAVGADGALWYSDADVSTIGRLTTAGSFSQFPVPFSSGDAAPSFIAPGPQNDLWFVNSSTTAGPLNQITTSGIDNAFLAKQIAPSSFVVGPDGVEWFTDFGTNSIGRVTEDGQVTEFPLPTANADPQQIVVGPDGNLWFTEQAANQIGMIQPSIVATAASPLVAAVLPASRSVEVDAKATAFVTVINSGSSTLAGCAIAPLVDEKGSFSYQATNAANAPVGKANDPVSIDAGAVANFIIALEATGPVSPTTVGFNIACDGTTGAASQPGLNTLLFSASSSPVPDVVALAATPSNDGTLRIAGTTGSGAFAVATINLGSAATITATPSASSSTLPVSVFICQTDPSSGQCQAAPATSVSANIAANGTPTFSVFAAASGAIPFAPASARINVAFTDSSGVIHGETSVAVTAQ
jgi:virginiamycin B lyase